MTFTSSSITARKALVLAVAVVFVLAQKSLLGQEQETKYSVEEYKAYQDIASETTPAKKTSLVIAFFKTYPQSTLKPNVIAAYQGMMGELQTGRKWQEIITNGQQYLAAGPDDLYTISLLATAYQETKNYRQFVSFGEKVFAQKPTPNLAYYLAKAYMDLKDDAKFMVWGERTAQLMPSNYEIQYELTRRFGLMQNNAQASKYAKLTLKAMQGSKMPEGTPEATWKSYTTGVYATCYSVIGNVAFTNRDYNTAISNLESSLKYYKKNDLVYYNLGQSYWQQNQIAMAMLNLAKAYLLNGTTSRAARQHLDNLYKTTHGQSLAGEEKIIARAQQELKQP